MTKTTPTDRNEAKRLANNLAELRSVCETVGIPAPANDATLIRNCVWLAGAMARDPDRREVAWIWLAERPSDDLLDIDEIG